MRQIGGNGILMILGNGRRLYSSLLGMIVLAVPFREMVAADQSSC